MTLSISLPKLIAVNMMPWVDCGNQLAHKTKVNIRKAEHKLSDISAHSQHTDAVVLDKKRAIIEAALAKARAKTIDAEKGKPA